MFLSDIKKRFLMRKQQLSPWVFSYLKDLIKNKEKPDSQKPIHIYLCICDHFEPGTGGVDPKQERDRVTRWVENYSKLANKHKDANGNVPQHTWFFPPHYHRQDHLERLVKLCSQGYGEIEMHLHHDRMEPWPDTPETLKEKIKKCIEDYSHYGIFGTDKDGKKRFAFIHGDWALDNSRGGKHCGINNEIQILKEMGCYADFTFPSCNEAQPKKINSIYYAKDDPDKPKSYDTGVDVKVGGTPWGDLMIIQGPLGFRWRGRKHRFYPSIESGNICATNPPTRERINFWIKTGIHVKGEPNHIFIKLHCHGAPEEDAKVLLGEKMDKMFLYLEKYYNDGSRYVLHYVTAREMYNKIKFLETKSYQSIIYPPEYKNNIIHSRSNKNE